MPQRRFVHVLHGRRGLFLRAQLRNGVRRVGRGAERRRFLGSKDDQRAVEESDREAVEESVREAVEESDREAFLHAANPQACRARPHEAARGSYIDGDGQSSDAGDSL